MTFNDRLTKREAVSLLEIIHEALGCNRESLDELFRRLAQLVPFDHAICGIGEINRNSVIQPHEIINISYPAEWLDRYLERDYIQVDPIIRENFTRYGLQYWEDTYRGTPPPKELSAEAADFGLTRGCSFGMRAPGERRGSILTLSGESIERNERTETILTHVMPHLHQTFVRIAAAPERLAAVRISSRERETLNWVKEGKSNWEISVILGISEGAVKFHIRNIMRKLNVVSRSHAVAVAFERGVIDPE